MPAAANVVVRRLPAAGVACALFEQKRLFVLTWCPLTDRNKYHRHNSLELWPSRCSQASNRLRESLF
jgi:hypothetical protein